MVVNLIKFLGKKFGFATADCWMWRVELSNNGQVHSLYTPMSSGYSSEREPAFKKAMYWAKFLDCQVAEYVETVEMVTTTEKKLINEFNV